MKRALFLALCVLAVNTVIAQVSRGQWLAGGQISYASRTQDIPNGDDHTVKTFSIAPGAGYFIVNKLALGARFNTTITKVPNGGNNTYVGAPFLRYYLLNKYARVNFLLDGSYTLGTFKSSAIERKMEGYTAMAGPVIFLNERVGLEITLSYNAEKTEGGHWFKTTKAGFGLQVHLGRERVKREKSGKKESKDWWE